MMMLLIISDQGGNMTDKELEPVAFMDYFGQVFNPAENQCYIRWTMRDRLPMEEDEVLIPLYTTQLRREWVGLTDEEKKAIYEKADSENWHDQPLLEAVEAKLKEKNGY
jgi:hypothetical protein